jgi:hypothetical protein
MRLNGGGIPLESQGHRPLSPRQDLYPIRATSMPLNDVRSYGNPPSVTYREGCLATLYKKKDGRIGLHPVTTTCGSRITFHEVGAVSDSRRRDWFMSWPRRNQPQNLDSVAVDGDSKDERFFSSGVLSLRSRCRTEVVLKGNRHSSP